jgi:branched-subunit amino acid transport protein
MKIYYIIAGLFMVTVLCRVGFIFLNKPLNISPNVAYVLRIVPTVALGTTVMLNSFFINNNFIGFVDNWRLYAVLACIAAYMLKPHLGLSLLSGTIVWCVGIYFH